MVGLRWDVSASVISPPAGMIMRGGWGRLGLRVREYFRGGRRLPVELRRLQRDALSHEL